MRRLKLTIAGLVPAGMAGAFVALTLGRTNPEEFHARLPLLILGGLWGVAVVGLIRLFRVRPWAFGLVGFLCGPVPTFLLGPGREAREAEQGDRLGIWLVLSLLGMLIGLLETARVQVRDRSEEE